MNTYTLFWLDGLRNTVRGKTIADAMNAAGYGAGAVRALDFWAHGDNHEHEWDNEARTWKKRATAAAEEAATHDG